MTGRFKFTNARTFLAATSVFAAACNTDDVTAPPLSLGAFTVNASQNWVYVSLIDSAIVVPTPSPTASDNWDIAFFATNVMLNGGQAGPGGVTGFCICQNEAETDQQVLAMTPESELEAFELTASASVPQAAAFVSEVLTPAIRNWYSGSAPAITPSGNTYVARLSDGASYAKLRITAISGATTTHAGIVTLEYALQASGATSFGASQTLQVNLATGAKSVDLNTGQVSTSPADWDVALDGFTIRVNGGASGSGNAGAFLSTTAYDNVAAATAPAIAYSADTYAGVFGEHTWYRYNILGDNRISPVFNVYLLRRGNIVWKLQLTSYYSATNQARHISFRYEQLQGSN